MTFRFRTDKVHEVGSRTSAFLKHQFRGIVLMEESLVIHPRVAFQQVEDGFFVITPDNALHQLRDEVAIVIWQALDQGPQKVEELVDAICEQFDVSPERAEADLKEFVQEGLKRGLITEKNEQNKEG